MASDCYSELAERFLRDSARCEIEFSSPLFFFFDRESFNLRNTHLPCDIYSKIGGSYDLVLRLLTDSKEDIPSALKEPKRVEKDGKLFIFLLSESLDARQRREMIEKYSSKVNS